MSIDANSAVIGVAPKNYKRTFVATFVAIFNQSIITNISAILLVPFVMLYGFSFTELGLLVAINFFCQMVADVSLSFFIDKVPFKPIAIAASMVSFIGLIFFGLTPYLFADNIFVGFVIATITFSFSGGMLEVVLSPIIDNIPNTKNKGMAMSLMHSFYAWGQVACILVTSCSLLIVGYGYWNYLLFVWAIVPLIACLLFIKAPIERREVEKKHDRKLKTFFSPFFLVALVAIMFGGATEIIMNQWVATFVQLGLKFDKAVADLVGMALFAVFLGLGRLWFGKYGDKLNLNLVLVVLSLSSVVLFLIVALFPYPMVALIACVLSGFTVSLLWPGTLVVTSKQLPMAGAWIFAVLAVAGDIGGSWASVVTGGLADNFGLNATFAILSVVPFVAFLAHLFLWKKSKHLSRRNLSVKELK